MFVAGAPLRLAFIADICVRWRRLWQSTALFSRAHCLLLGRLHPSSLAGLRFDTRQGIEVVLQEGAKTTCEIAAECQEVLSNICSVIN